jgi:hypothetical protein
MKSKNVPLTPIAVSAKKHGSSAHKLEQRNELLYTSLAI